MDKIAYIFAAGDYDKVSVSLNPQDVAIAADGGYDRALAMGITCTYIIGDMDSVKGSYDSATVFKHNPDKDYTDLHLAIDLALELGYNDIVILCAFGGRISHSLSAILTLDYIRRKSANGIMLGSNYRVGLCENRATIQKHAYNKISLIPLTPEAVGVTTTGLLYPLQNYTMTQHANLGISNEFTEETATITLTEGTLLIICEID